MAGQYPTGEAVDAARTSAPPEISCSQPTLVSATSVSSRMLADQVVVLQGGKVVEQGLALDVIRSPKDEFTRTLLEAIPHPFDDGGPNPEVLGVVPVPQRG